MRSATGGTPVRGGWAGGFSRASSAISGYWKNRRIALDDARGPAPAGPRVLLDLPSFLCCVAQSASYITVSTTVTARLPEGARSAEVSSAAPRRSVPSHANAPGGMLVAAVCAVLESWVV